MGHRAVSHLHFVRGATELASGEIEHAGFDLCRGEAHGIARKVSDSAFGGGVAIGGDTRGGRGASAVPRGRDRAGPPARRSTTPGRKPPGGRRSRAWRRKERYLYEPRR